MTFNSLFVIIFIVPFLSNNSLGANAIKKPKPRVTKIIESTNIGRLFYEGFKRTGSKKQEFDNDDLIVAFYYNGIRFDLFEPVKIKFSRRLGHPDFAKIEGQPFFGRIVSIEPDSEIDENKLIVRVDDCESQEQELFMVTEIKKERASS